jgi:predicted Rossmann fold nucleotide-binding protein DprA/Smf involved in DNA uptake
MNLTRRKWPRVVSCLRTSDTAFGEFAQVLRSAGFWEEAVALELEGLRDEASRLIESGRVLTAVDDGYPARWINRLGDGAPPALWRQGSPASAPLIGVVGSRHISPEVRDFALEIGREAVRLGYGVVSGGAAGCDNAGASGAVSSGGFALEVLPNGIDQYKRRDRCGLSVCAPDEIFSTAAAMERNALIYAASELTVVVQAQFKSGGTWIGAVEATRKRICPLVVRDDGSQAARAVIALGGSPIQSAAELEAAVASRPAQSALFELG